MGNETDDLTLRMRAVGGRQAAREVDSTTGAVKRFGRHTKTARREAGLFGRTTGVLFKPFRHLKQEAFGMAKGMAAAGLAFGSVEGIKKSIETTDELVKTTVRLHNLFGLTTQTASGLAGVLEARDLQPQALTMGLTSLSKQLVAAEHGTKKAQGAFRIFGIDARDVHKAVGSQDGLASVFDTVVDQMSQMHGGARKAALGQQLLGRASRGLAPLMQEGALGLKQQLKWAKEYGVTLDDKTVGSVEDMAAAQTQAQYAMLGLQIQLGRFAAPAVAKANVALADIVSSFRDGRPEGDKFARTVFQLGKDLEPVGKDLLKVGGYLKDHPHVLQAAAVAYGAYRLKLLKLITLAPKAYLKGLLAGKAYALGFNTGAGGAGVPGVPGGTPGRGGPGGRGGGRGRGLPFPFAIPRLPMLVKGPLGVYAAHLIARHILHSHNADPLDFLDPETAGWNRKKEHAHLRAMRGRGLNGDQTVDYFRRHPRELTPDVVSALTRRQQRDLGVRLAPNAAGGYAVIHMHVTIDGKEVAKSVRRVAIKKKATR
jgi:hypothetical protein